MSCIGTIDGGAQRAREELLFLNGLLIKLGCCIEVQSNLPRSLGLTDIYRSPAFGAGNFIRINKASEDLTESLATLRSLANERVLHLIKTTDRHDLPPIERAQPSSFANI